MPRPRRTSSRPPAAAASTADEIQRLADLKAQGVISDAEFEAGKAKALGQLNASSTGSTERGPGFARGLVASGLSGVRSPDVRSPEFFLGGFRPGRGPVPAPGLWRAGRRSHRSHRDDPERARRCSGSASSLSSPSAVDALPTSVHCHTPGVRVGRVTNLRPTGLWISTGFSPRSAQGCSPSNARSGTARCRPGVEGGGAGVAVVQAIESVRRRASGRVPPHNLEAEESLLGAMLLSRDAITAAVEAHVETSDFYKPAHGHIFEAIQSLHGQGEPVDPVTVAEELRRADLLDALGGRPALLRIQADTPASANAGHYARIVDELALLRRLIGVAGDIAEMGYDEPDDVTETLDRAEALVFEVAERRVVRLDGRHPRRAAGHPRRSSRRCYGDDSELIGVPTGLRRARQDAARAAALEPDRSLAARPGQGKTSFALGAGRRTSPSTTGKPVVFFSMEMGCLELTKRLLAAEAGVDARKPADRRSSSEPTGPKISHAVGRLAEAPLLHRRQPALHGDGDAGQGAPRCSARHGDLGLDRRRLHPADDADAPAAVREPPGRGVGDLPRPEDPRPRARVPGDGAVAAQPPARVPPGQAPDARRPP